jgi:hypothetical protein
MHCYPVATNPQLPYALADEDVLPASPSGPSKDLPARPGPGRRSRRLVLTGTAVPEYVQSSRLDLLREVRAM